MNRIRIALAGADRDYLIALARALALRESGLAVTLEESGIAAGQIEAKQGSNGAIEPFDIRLFEGETALEPVVDHLPARLLLVETESDNPENSGRLFKYSGVAEIEGALLSLYGQLAGGRRRAPLPAEARLIACTSSAGGVGTTSVCLSVAREIAYFHHRRTLFLSLEDPCSAVAYFPEYESHESARLGDYIYYLFSENRVHMLDYPEKFLFVDRWGLETVLADPQNEAAGLRVEELEQLIAAIARARRYEYVFLDVPGDNGERLASLIDRCAGVLLIDDGMPSSLVKNATLRRRLGLSAAAAGRLKNEAGTDFLIVRNRCRAAMPEEAEAACWLAEDQESFRAAAGSIAIDLSRGFGLGVKRLADELVRIW